MSDVSAPPPPVAIDPRIGRYQQLLSAANLAGALGRNDKQSRFQAQAQKLGNELGSAAAGVTGTDFTDPNFSLVKAMGLKGVYTGGADSFGSTGFFNSKLGLLRGAAQARANQEYETKYADPVFDQAQKTMGGIASSPTYGGEFLAGQRNAIDGLHNSEGDRLARVASALGIRQFDGSAGGAAVTSHGMFDAGAAAADSQRGLDMEAEQGNRQGAIDYVGLAPALAISRLGTHMTRQQQDQERIAGLSDEVSQITEAIRQHQIQNQQNRKARHRARTQAYIKAAASLGGAGIGGFAAGVL